MKLCFSPPPCMAPQSSFLWSCQNMLTKCVVAFPKAKKPLNINTVCVYKREEKERKCFFFLIFLLSFDSFLFCLETYWDACMAEKSCDELLIVDSFIKAPRRTRTWHFLTLNLQRTDTNALMLFKLVYKLRRVGGTSCFKKGRKKKPDVQVLTDLAWKHQQAHSRKCVCVDDCVFGFAWGNVHQTLKNVWRTQPFSFSTQRKRANGSQNARGKHSSNSVRAKGADQRESCLQFRPTRQFFPRLPGERAQREINLRYQFAEFCSIDGWVPRDFTLGAQEPGPVNKIT